MRSPRATRAVLFTLALVVTAGAAAVRADAAVLPTPLDPSFTAAVDAAVAWREAQPPPAPPVVKPRRPAPAPPASSPPRKHEAAPSGASSPDDAFWRRLANCEHPPGDDRDNGGGYFQLAASTRRAVGVSASDSYAVQLAGAKEWARRIHPREGTTAGWPVCWWRAQG